MSAKPENIALVDMDGTLVDYEGTLTYDLRLLSSPEEPEYSIAETHNDGAPDFIRNRIKMIREIPGWWRNLPRLHNGFLLLEVAKTVGFEIVILTKGPSSNPTAWKEKVEWVRDHLGDVKITITEDKGLVYGKMLVDDYLPYMTRWLTWRPRGLGIMPVDLRYHKLRNFTTENVLQYSGQTTQMNEIVKAMEKAYNR